MENDGSYLQPQASHSVPVSSSSVAVLQPVMPQPLSQDTVAGATTVRRGNSVPSRGAMQQPVHNTINRDAVVPLVDVLTSIPSISSAMTQLLASYDQQAVQDALLGEAQVNSSEGITPLTPLWLVPSLGGPIRGWYLPLMPKKPAYDELNLPQWVAGQLSNALYI